MPLCNSASEDLNHLWTCLYIIPDVSPGATYCKYMATFRDACIKRFSDCTSLPDSFKDTFSALACWNFDTHSPSCLWLTRGLLPTDLIAYLKEFLPKTKILTTLTPLLF
ncbi:unnamed protein product [Rhizophagus irregularis]|nr:unnamed protein product [Rhizophagus irregularis]